MDETRLTFSKQQGRVIALMMQGYENEEIAKELGLKLRTVKAHFNRIFLQIGITSGIKRVKLGVLLYRNGYKIRHEGSSIQEEIVTCR